MHVCNSALFFAIQLSNMMALSQWLPSWMDDAAPSFFVERTRLHAREKVLQTYNSKRKKNRWTKITSPQTQCHATRRDVYSLSNPARLRGLASRQVKPAALINFNSVVVASSLTARTDQRRNKPRSSSGATPSLIGWRNPYYEKSRS